VPHSLRPCRTSAIVKRLLLCHASCFRAHINLLHFLCSADDEAASIAQRVLARSDQSDQCHQRAMRHAGSSAQRDATWRARLLNGCYLPMELNSRRVLTLAPRVHRQRQTAAELRGAELLWTRVFLPSGLPTSRVRCASRRPVRSTSFVLRTLGTRYLQHVKRGGDISSCLWGARRVCSQRGKVKDARLGRDGALSS